MSVDQAAVTRDPPPSLFSGAVGAGSSAYASPTYAILCDRSGPFWDTVRATLDRWYVRLPEQAQRSIHQRFSSASRGDHLGALWELYLHEAFCRMGFAVTPDVGNDAVEGQRLPDFRLERDGRSIYVEATVCLGDDVLTSAQQEWTAKLKDLVDTADVPNFFVHMQVETYGSLQLRRSEVVRPLERWLNALDPDRLLVRQEAGCDRETLTITPKDCEVTFEAIPLRPDLRGGNDHRLLGEFTTSVKHIDDVPLILRKLTTKAKRYGTLDAPLVIAIMCAGTFAGESETEQALFGEIGFGFDGAGEVFRLRSEKGLWQHPDGRPRNQHIPAVIAATQLSATSIGIVRPCWWINPQASVVLDNPTSWDTAAFRPGRDAVVATAQMSPADVLGLSPTWPDSRGA